jgi:quercetin dioxygenase-like cupin family protein
MDVFPTKEAAEQAKGSGGTVVESLGKVWLLTVGEKLKVNPAGIRVTQMGPLPVKTGQTYTAQYMEATLLPGMVSKTHVHAGVEAFYTESGETCLETPDGKQIGRTGKDIVIPKECRWSLRQRELRCGRE